MHADISTCHCFASRVARSQTIAPVSARFCSLASGTEERVVYSNLCFVSVSCNFFWVHKTVTDDRNYSNCTLYTGVLRVDHFLPGPALTHKHGRCIAARCPHCPRFRSACLLHVVVKQLQGCQVLLTSRCPDSTSSSGVWKPFEMPYRNVRRLKDSFERSIIFGTFGVPVDKDREVLTRPLVCSRWPTKGKLPTFIASMPGDTIAKSVTPLVACICVGENQPP